MSRASKPVYDLNPPQLDFAAALFEGHAEQANLVKESFPIFPSVPEYLPIYSVKLVRTNVLALTERARIRGPAEAASLAWDYLKDCDREHVLSLLLDAKASVIGMNVISVGDLCSSILNPREVLKPAILCNAVSFVLAHNHPSGDPTPSPEDIAVTRRVHEAARVMGIDLLDHVIVGEGGRYRSLKDAGAF